MSDWTERFKNPEKKLHRDEKPVPIDPVERASRMQWLLNHPMWRVPHTYGGGEVHMDDMFARCVDFWFHHRDPETDDVSDDPSKNTKFSILIEAGILESYAGQPFSFLGGNIRVYERKHDIS